MGICCFCCRWSLIAGRLPGRTDNEIKNYWNTHIRRKLLNRGIDPTTHRPLNEPAAQEVTTTTISFTNVKEDHKENKVSTSGFVCKEEKTQVQEKCPDLNLELKISLPCHTQSEPLKIGGRSPCFACSLGLQNSKDCSCNMATGIGGSGSSSNSARDFLGLKNGVLEYRSSLEMK